VTPPTPRPVPPAPPARPVDVDTGFWLWVVALPLLVTGYLTDVVTSPSGVPVVIAFAAFVAVVLVAVVVTFLMLMRAGYRWARTGLTAGGLTAIIYVAINLFTMRTSTAGALVYAGTGIVGAVLVGGGMFLVHRPDAQAYFTR
jgi:hypothetical protein